MGKEVANIREAIMKACNRDIIVLASASNEGLNKPITFPASIGEPNVFCIGSADATGTRSKFSPVAKGVPKYSAVGEAVLGAALSKTEPRMTKSRKDGTSISNPVAAGIAALPSALTFIIVTIGYVIFESKATITNNMLNF